MKMMMMMMMMMMKQRSRAEKPPKKGEHKQIIKQESWNNSNSMVGFNKPNQQKCVFIRFLLFLPFFSSVCRPFLIYILFSLSLVLLQSERTGLFVVLLFCFCCLGSEQRKNDQKKTQNPCFIVFLFVLLSLQVLATERPILREKNKR